MKKTICLLLALVLLSGCSMVVHPPTSREGKVTLAGGIAGGAAGLVVAGLTRSPVAPFVVGGLLGGAFLSNIFYHFFGGETDSEASWISEALNYLPDGGSKTYWDKNNREWSVYVYGTRYFDGGLARELKISSKHGRSLTLTFVNRDNQGWDLSPEDRRRLERFRP